MCRLLSPVRLLLIHLPTAGAHACRHTSCPRRFFLASLTDSLVSPLGWGVAAVPPQPAFWR
jgi:hypothetical protein